MVALGRVRRNKLFYSVQQFTDSLQHPSLQQLLLHSPVLQPSLQQPSAQQVSLQQVSILSDNSFIKKSHGYSYDYNVTLYRGNSKLESFNLHPMIILMFSI